MNIPKIRCSSQRPKNVTNIISRRNTFLINRVPIAKNNVLNYFDAGVVDVDDGQRESATLVVEEVLDYGFAGVFAVELMRE